MKNNLQNTDNLIEKKIDWQVIQSAMRTKFGHDIFESWLKKIELVDEFKNYILISVSTRFIRDWITSRYLDQILAIVREHKKDIIRIEFLIEDINKVISNKKEQNEDEKKVFEINGVDFMAFREMLKMVNCSGSQYLDEYATGIFVAAKKFGLGK